MMPQTSRSSASARIRNRWLNARSTNRRIMVSRLSALLLDGALQHQRLQDHALTRADAGSHFLQVARELRAAHDLDALKAARAGRYVDPIPVVQMQEGARRHDSERLRRRPVERGGDEH